MSDENVPKTTEAEVVEAPKVQTLLPTFQEAFLWKDTRTTNDDQPKGLSIAGWVSGAARPTGDVRVIVSFSRANKKLGEVTLDLLKTSSVRPEITEAPQQLFAFRIVASGDRSDGSNFSVVNYMSDGRTNETFHSVPSGNTKADVIVRIQKVEFNNTIESDDDWPSTEYVEFTPGTRKFPFSLTVDEVEQNEDYIAWEAANNSKASDDAGRELGRGLTD